MLAREFLRLTALEALRPSAYLNPNQQMLDKWLDDWAERGYGTIAPPHTPWPTLAGLYVSDSRIDPIDDLNGEEKRPLIGVYTENTSLTKIAQAGPQFYRGDVDLVFEISVVANFNVGDGEGGTQLLIDYADTDAAIEATLGVLEEQIYHALHFGPSGALFRRMCKLPFDGWESTIKHRNGEESIRLAARTIRARVCMKEACYDPAPSAVPADFDRLPGLLKSIATQLGESTYLHELALGMARMAPVMPTRVNLNTVGITTAPQPGVSGTEPVQGTAKNLQG